MNERQLTLLLQQVQQGEMEIEAALDRLKTLPFENLDFAKVDHHRTLRRGLPEVVYALGKQPEQIAAIVQSQSRTESPVLVTRLHNDVYSQISHDLPEGEYYPEAGIFAMNMPETPELKARVVVLSAGTSDQKVAREALITLRAFSIAPQLIQDVGVAGIHRLFDQLDTLHKADVVVVVAGMDGALPSVTAGLIDAPVIAVPTSVGYGASFGGVSALLSMINSCSSGITVVNIDNGFGGGYAAGLIARKIVS